MRIFLTIVIFNSLMVYSLGARATELDNIKTVCTLENGETLTEYEIEDLVQEYFEDHKSFNLRDETKDFMRELCR